MMRLTAGKDRHYNSLTGLKQRGDREATRWETYMKILIIV